MSLKKLEDYEDLVIKICPNGTEGEIIEIGNLAIMLPKQPDKKLIFGNNKKVQMWERESLPEELVRIKSMDDWAEMPKEFRQRFQSYIEEEFRGKKGFGFLTMVIRPT